jgi:hypothetical protein
MKKILNQSPTVRNPHFPRRDHRDIHLGRDLLDGSSTFAIDVMFVKGGPIYE